MKTNNSFSEQTPPRLGRYFAKFFALFFCLVMGMNVWGAEIFSFAMTSSTAATGTKTASGGTAVVSGSAFATGGSNEVTVGSQTYFKFNSSSTLEVHLSDANGNFAIGDVITITCASNASSKKTGKGVKIGPNGSEITLTADFPAGESNTLTYTVASNDGIVGENTFKIKRADSDIKFGIVTVDRTASASYTLSFNANGGTGTVADITGSGSQTLPNASTLTAPTGKEFKEWNTKDDGTGTSYAAGASYSLSANATLYAIWQDETVKSAIVYANTKGASTAALPTQYSEGVGIAEFAALEDVTGFHFTGWNPSSISSSATGEQTISAEWEAIPTDIFKMVMKSFSSDVSKASTDPEFEVNSSYTSSIEGGSVYGGCINASSKKVLSKNGTVNFGGNDAYLKIVLDEDLRAGDVISFVGGTVQMAISLGKTVNGVNALAADPAKAVSTTDGKYTVSAGDLLQGETVIYVWRATGSSPAWTTIKVTRPADSTPNQKWNVTFDKNGATSADIAAQSVVNGKKAVKPEDPEKDGFNFVKWVVAATEADYDFDASVTADVALKAVWEEITTSWTVTYNANGGTCGTASATWTGGDALVLPAAEFTGKLFDGWYDSEDNLIGKAGDEYTPTDNIELFAHYSYEKILRKAVFSNSFEAWIDEAAKTATVFYLDGETAPTYVEGVASTGCTITLSDGKLIVKDVEEATVEYVLTMTAVTPATVPVEKITPATAAEAEVSWIKNHYGWESSKGWKFAKTGDDADWSRRTNGNNHIYLFVGACENVKLTWKANRAVKVYRNGTEVSATTADGVLTIPGDIVNASMIKIASNQNSGDGGFSAVEVLAHVVGTDATLKDLQVNGETVEGFAAATETYDVELPFTASVVPTVTATATDANATSVVVSDATELPGATTIVVTAEDGTTTKTYTINFTKAAASSDATLNAINVAGELIAGFDAETLAYTVEREYGDDVIPAVEGIKNHVAATVVPATVGNVVTLTVTAEDGITVKAYTVTFTNKAASADATLKSLKQGTTAITLVAEQYTYDVNLPYGTAAVPALTAEVNEAHATAVVTDAAAFDAEGLATSTVVVTAQDGTTELTYTIKFAKALYPSVVIFDGATMTAVATSPDASGLAWSVTGFSSVTNYSVSCAGKDYTKTLPSGGNGGDTRYFEVVVPVNHIARFYTVFGSHSSDSRSFSIGTSKAKEIETGIYSATSPNRTTLIAGYSEWVEAGTYYIKPNASVDFYEVSVQLQAVDPKCEAPVITTQPETNKQFGAGAMTATVVASVEDGGELSYQWYNEADEAVVGATAATLSTETEGKYYVVITNTLAAHRDNSTKSDIIELAHRVMNDATLSALTYGSPATTITLVADQYEYDVELAKGTAEVPALTATTNSNYASKVINDAAAFVDYAATSTVVVTAEDGIATQTYTVNFTVRHDVDLQDVTGDMTFNFVGAVDADVNGINDGTYGVLANYDGVKSQANGQYVAADFNKITTGNLQGKGLKFHTTTPLFITVEFSNTGSSARPDRELYVNGVATGVKSKNTTKVTYTQFVEAGDVVLTAFEEGKTWNMLNFYNVTFSTGATVRTGLTEGKMGTICLPKEVTAMGGATFYQVEKPTAIGVDLVEATAPYAAGTPYIFEANASEIKVVYGEGVATEALTVNGLVGNLTGSNMAITNNDQNYIVQNNHLRLCVSGNYVANERAYLDMKQVTDMTVEEPEGNAPLRRISLGGAEADVVTGFEDILANEDVQKLLIEGNIFIIRDGKMYNALGQLVK